jgi:hypothetical protein
MDRRKTCMKISAALKDAFRVYFDRFGATVKFLVVEACITLAAVIPLLFLTNDKLRCLRCWRSFWILLVSGRG